jgi:hypothetical protein
VTASTLDRDRCARQIELEATAKPACHRLAIMYLMSTTRRGVFRPALKSLHRRTACRRAHAVRPVSMRRGAFLSSNQCELVVNITVVGELHPACRLIDVERTISLGSSSTAPLWHGVVVTRAGCQASIPAWSGAALVRLMATARRCNRYRVRPSKHGAPGPPPQSSAPRASISSPD